MRGAPLHTYSASTSTRSGLLLGGFAVGVGDPTGEHDETTIAATRVADLARPLGKQWLGRLAHSSVPLPSDVPSGSCRDSEQAQRRCPGACPAHRACRCRTNGSTSASLRTHDSTRDLDLRKSQRLDEEYRHECAGVRMQIVDGRDRPRVGVPVLVALMVLAGSGAAHAAFTTGACLAKKRIVWGDFRDCQATEASKTLKGKTADLTKCQTKLEEKLGKLDVKAAKARIACRYGDGGETVTDYDTGLEWEKKEGESGGPCLIVSDRVNRCVNDNYSWDRAHAFAGSLNGSSATGLTTAGALAGVRAWRLPTITELHGIVDATVPGAATGSAAIDPIFGPTANLDYWSATALTIDVNHAWYVNFFGGGLESGQKAEVRRVRAVRTAF